MVACMAREPLLTHAIDALVSAACGACQVMRLTVVNVGGLDIIDGNHKLILAIMWQLMRRHTLNLLQVRSRRAAGIRSRLSRRLFFCLLMSQG